MTEKEEKELKKFNCLAPNVYRILEKYFNCNFCIYEAFDFCDIYVDGIGPIFARIERKANSIRYVRGIYIIKNLYVDNRKEDFPIQTTCSSVVDFEFFLSDDVDKFELYVQKLVKQIKDLQVEKHIAELNKDFK